MSSDNDNRLVSGIGKVAKALLPLAAYQGLRRWKHRLRSSLRNLPRLGTPKVELFYWRPSETQQNFGDALSKVVVDRMLAMRGLSLDDEAVRPARLLAVGTILLNARDGDVLWGTGRKGLADERDYVFRSLDVRSLRGPLTRDFLLKKGIAAPAIYGDPVLLLPRLLPGWFAVTAEQPYCLVGHVFDPQDVLASPDVISPLLPWQQIVASICSSRFVVASSLHGLVVAEAYGIGARYVRFSEREPLLKYEDYYLGTGRQMPDVARSLAEALEMGPVPPPTVDLDAVAGAFPFDLWRADRGGTR